MKSPVFIVGCDRSGTTLLRLMLNQSSEIYITPETKFLIPLQEQTIYGDFTQPAQRYFFIRDLQTNRATSKTFTFSVLGLTIAEAETALAQAAPTDFTGAAEAIFTAVARKHNKQRWGDKTPHQVQNISSLAKMFPNAQFIHMIRDGRGAAVSIRKAGWHNGNLLKIAQYWQKQVNAGIKAGRALDSSRYYEVYYEKLLTQPEVTLRDLCNWLHLEYTPQMLEYYRDANSNIQPEHQELFKLNQKPIDAGRIDAWKSQLSEQDTADFESIAANMLQKLGYELDGAKIAPEIKLTRALKHRFTPLLNDLKQKLQT